MDRLDELSILIAIVDEGSLAGAARRLHRSGPAITRALNALEDRIGTRLIQRTTRRLAPTEQGLFLVERARVLLADYQATMHGAAIEPLRGLLRVTAPVQFGRKHVAVLVERFLDAYPELQVELVLNDRNLDLIEEGLDVAIRIGALPDSSLIASRVGEVRRVLVASPDYLARRGTPVRPADLVHHDSIFGTARALVREWRFASREGETIVRLTPRFLVNDTEAQLVAARAGRGIARILSYQAADDLAAGTLLRLLGEYEPAALPVQLVVSGGRYMAPKVRAFLDHAAPALRALPAIRPWSGPLAGS